MTRFLQKFLAISVISAASSLPAQVSMGPLFHDFGLTLDRGDRKEALGPLFYYENRDATRTWATPPLLSYVLDEEADFSEFDLLYPLVTYDRFGLEYRFQILQVFAFAGGQTYSETNVHRFTLFPIYFHQWSDVPERNYWALLPIY